MQDVHRSAVCGAGGAGGGGGAGAPVQAGVRGPGPPPPHHTLCQQARREPGHQVHQEIGEAQQ